jgi:hypothetical protein
MAAMLSQILLELTYQYWQADIQPAASSSAKVDETIAEEPEAEEVEKVCLPFVGILVDNFLCFYLQA